MELLDQPVLGKSWGCVLRHWLKKWLLMLSELQQKAVKVASMPNPGSHKQWNQVCCSKVSSAFLSLPTSYCRLSFTPQKTVHAPTSCHALGGSRQHALRTVIQASTSAVTGIMHTPGFSKNYLWQEKSCAGHKPSTKQAEVARNARIISWRKIAETHISGKCVHSAPSQRRHRVSRGSQSDAWRPRRCSGFGKPYGADHSWTNFKSSLLVLLVQLKQTFNAGTLGAMLARLYSILSIPCYGYQKRLYGRYLMYYT